jgi:hypothetical protein
MSEQTPRRSLIALVAVLTLLGAVAVVRGASAWTAASAPLSAKPVDAQMLAAELRDEQSRSTSLRSQLDGVSANARQLVAALQEAQSKAVYDAKAAAMLAAQLKAAMARLAALQGTSGVGTSPAATTTFGAQTGASPTPAAAPVDDDGGTDR